MVITKAFTAFYVKEGWDVWEGYCLSSNDLLWQGETIEMLNHAESQDTVTKQNMSIINILTDSWQGDDDQYYTFICACLVKLKKVLN